MSYLREILGTRYLKHSDWEAKKVREAEEFKVRLASLPADKAAQTCTNLLAMTEGVHYLISDIARAWLAATKA